PQPYYTAILLNICQRIAICCAEPYVQLVIDPLFVHECSTKGMQANDLFVVLHDEPLSSSLGHLFFHSRRSQRFYTGLAHIVDVCVGDRRDTMSAQHHPHADKPW